MRRSATSLHSSHRPSIDWDRRTIDIAGEWRSEKSYEMPDVVRLTEIASGNVLLDEVDLRLLRWMQFLNLSRVDATGGDRVHGNAMRAELGGQCPGPADERCFGLSR